ncbi:MAG: hypothetical protein WC621_05150 [Patescibacteria group bacterium]
MELDLLDPDLVQRFVEQKNKMQELALKLAEINSKFLELSKTGMFVSVTLVAERERLRGRFNEAQAVYLDIIKNIRNHKEIFKQVRLSKIKNL